MKTQMMLGLIGCLLAFTSNSQQRNAYELKIDASLRTLSVSASLERKGDQLFMDWEAAEFLEDGWSTYVENLKAFTNTGDAIDLSYEQPGTWTMTNHNNASHVNFTYDVRIAHDSIVWEEGGHDESAYVLDDLLFFIGRVAFITAGQRPEIPDQESYVITFADVPDDYSVTTIWNSNGTSYIANGTHELIGSLTMVGDLMSNEVKKGGATVVLAGAPSYEKGLETFASVFEPLLEVSQEAFGNLDGSKFVLAANIAPATQDPYFSGGVLNKSISIISPFIPDESILPMVQYILFHEYMHVYTWAMNIDPEETYSTYWFTEGVHDYMSSVLLLNAGQVSANEFLNGEQGLAGNWKRYKAANKINIREAGKTKFDNYDLVYSGGHLIGAMMDITFINASDGSYNLLHYIKEVLGLGAKRQQKGDHVRFDDLRSLAIKKGGKAMKKLFDQHIVGDQPIAIDAYLKMLELSLTESTEEVEISMNDQQSSQRDYYLSR